MGVGNSNWDQIWISMYMKRNVTHLISATLHHHCPVTMIHVFQYEHTQRLTHECRWYFDTQSYSTQNFCQKHMWKLWEVLHVAAVAKLSLSRNEEHNFLLYVETYLPNYTVSHSKRQYISLRRSAHKPRFKMKQMVHVARKSYVIDGYVLFTKL